jgi:AcrR family transcriptional regulator
MKHKAVGKARARLTKRPRGRPPAALADLEAAHAAARNRICDAALGLFDRGGIDAISMREIAGQIGVSPMMPYKYFRTKDHLLQELRTRAFVQLEQAMRAAAAHEQKVGARLRLLLLAYLRFGLADPRSYRLMFDYWVYDNPSRMIEDFGDATRRQSGAWNMVQEVVEHYCAEAHVKCDSLTVAHLIWAGLHGLVSLQASHKLVMGRRFEELMSPMVDAIMRGLAQAPETP